MAHHPDIALVFEEGGVLITLGDHVDEPVLPTRRPLAATRHALPCSVVARPHPLGRPLEGDAPPAVVPGALVLPHALQGGLEVVAAEHVVHPVASIRRRAGWAWVADRGHADVLETVPKHLGGHVDIGAAGLVHLYAELDDGVEHLLAVPYEPSVGAVPLAHHRERFASRVVQLSPHPGFAADRAGVAVRRNGIYHRLECVHAAVRCLSEQVGVVVADTGFVEPETLGARRGFHRLRRCPRLPPSVLRQQPLRRCDT